MQVDVTTTFIESHVLKDMTLKSINWNNSSDRKWLTNHMHWAMHNDRIVTIAPHSESI